LYYGCKQHKGWRKWKYLYFCLSHTQNLTLNYIYCLHTGFVLERMNDKIHSLLQYIQEGLGNNLVCEKRHAFPRTFVPTRFLTGTDIRAHIKRPPEHSCSHQMTTPDIRAHIKWPPRIFVLISNYQINQI